MFRIGKTTNGTYRICNRRVSEIDSWSPGVKGANSMNQSDYRLVGNPCARQGSARSADAARLF